MAQALLNDVVMVVGAVEGQLVAAPAGDPHQTGLVPQVKLEDEDDATAWVAARTAASAAACADS